MMEALLTKRKRGSTVERSSAGFYEVMASV